MVRLDSCFIRECVILVFIVNVELKMKHQHIQKHLSAYLDNELAPVLRKKVEDHLHLCEECALMLSDFRENQRQIAGLVHPAPSMKHAVLAKIREAEAVPHSTFLDVFKRWVFRPFTVGATAFSTLCFIFAFFYFSSSPAPQHDELIDFYFGVHTEEVANNPFKSNVATPLNMSTTGNEDFGEGTETLLDLYFDD